MFMPRYYFHLHNDVEAPDEEGKEFPDLTAAKAYAIREARILAAEQIKERGDLVLHHRIDIADESGTVLESVRWADVVHFRP